jgi:hypothetical protein
LDPRLRSAVDASVGWYVDVCAVHGVGSILEDGMWSALAPPPRLHSDVVVVEPEVTADRVLDRMRGRPHGSFKDSFATMDAPDGMELLFSATWVHLEAAQRSAGGAPSPWSAVSTEEELAAWTASHDTTGVLLPGLLARANFRFLARYLDGRIVAGAVARLGSGVVDLSNVYAVPPWLVDWAELATAVALHFPDRPLVGYERGEALTSALDSGFVPTGELRVWIR